MEYKFFKPWCKVQIGRHSLMTPINTTEQQKKSSNDMNYEFMYTFHVNTEKQTHLTIGRN